MIQLYLMRHGQAEPMSTDDTSRALTSHGRAEVHQVATNHLAEHTFDQVFVSPYLRAQQTLDVIKEVGVTIQQEETVSWITPESKTQFAIDQLIGAVKDDARVLLVCHQPFVGKLATKLTDGNDFGLVVATAGLFVIETDVVAAQCGTLRNTFKP